MKTLLLIIAANWGLCIGLSWIYICWLWFVSKDIKFDGWSVYRKFLPIARFRLTSTKSWYARAWNNWYGFSMFMAMLHRDEESTDDDELVMQTIVHETHHIVFQLMPLGALFWVIYLLDTAYLKLFTNKDPYLNNTFEVGAQVATMNWLKMGRPPIVTFGKRH